VNAEDTETILAATDRLAKATRVALALGALADSWETQAAADQTAAWHSDLSACRAQTLRVCAKELRETIRDAAEDTASLAKRKD